MADLLPEAPLMLPITNTQRRDAALTLARIHPQKSVLAYFLVQLGLARHEADETFVSTPDFDGVSWFSRTQVAGGAYRLAADALDDCR